MGPLGARGGPLIRRVLSAGLILGTLLVLPEAAQAYIGPGAGIAFVSSFLIVLVTFLLAFLTLLTWPFRWVLRTIRGRRALGKSRVKRVVIVGLDGQDPNITDRLMGEGRLPNFARLAKEGAYCRLSTTLPAESPVAWSSFQTGCNPGKHRVFDFLVPDRKSYLPKLCSADIAPPKRHLNLGRYRIPLGRARIRFERKSQSFWKILGDHGIFSNILRVPISFPAEKFHGLLLSAMSAPDLRGTQGTFSYYTRDPAEQKQFTAGTALLARQEGKAYNAEIAGPENPLDRRSEEMRLAFRVEPARNGGPPTLVVGGRSYPLPLRRFTPWIPLEFRAGLGMKIHGICQFYLLEHSPRLKLYMSPINIDPEKPALPVSHPVTYSMYLAKTQGPFSTLGVAEDTWALNERILDEAGFLEQCYSIHQERERMFFDAIEKTRRGLVTCVFDITDRLQHMFWRYLEDDHPANPGKDTTQHRDAIPELYERMDELVGRIREKVGDDTYLIVMSDHGFNSFQRGVNLNTWLHQNGFLSVRSGPSGAEWFEEVEWAKTQAYAVGLGGIYLNLKGREAKGIVEPGAQAARVKNQIREKLSSLSDPRDGKPAVGHVYDSREAFQGPYVGEGPDLIVGFEPGYRVAWTSATGAVTGEVFEDNRKSWSGDHCMDPPRVPGVFFCNHPVGPKEVGIMDIAPTVLELFGVEAPPYMDGKTLLQDSRLSSLREGRT